MRKKAYDYVKNCLTCLILDISINQFEDEIQPFPSPSAPFEILHLDHFGPFKKSENRKKYILIVIDAITRFTWLFSIKSIKESYRLSKANL